MNLSPKSIRQTEKLLQEYEERFKDGVRRAVDRATEQLYKKIIENCDANNLGEFTDAIQWEYDKKKNVGKVWVTSEGEGSNGLVIILNEFGTGKVKGGKYNKAYAAEHKYKINMSGKGDTGWAFPTKDGTMKWTHGIPSKLMFYEACNDISKEFKDILNIEINGSVGKMYTKERTD